MGRGEGGGEGNRGKDRSRGEGGGGGKKRPAYHTWTDSLLSLTDPQSDQLDETFSVEERNLEKKLVYQKIESIPNDRRESKENF